jgi:hypothetical protein
MFGKAGNFAYIMPAEMLCSLLQSIYRTLSNPFKRKKYFAETANQRAQLAGQGFKAGFCAKVELSVYF